VSSERIDPEDLQAFLEQNMQELLQSEDLYRIEHTVQVTSFGGSGTTALCAHLLAADVDLQPGPAQWPFKHRRQPPSADEVPDGFRVLYLVGDPRDAVLSIFRRNLQFGHYGGVHGRAPDDEVRRRLATLEGFLATGVDEFELADHVDGWLNHPSGYPVLVIRYEHVVDHWDRIREFLQLEPGNQPPELRPRRSDWTALAEPMRGQLQQMYGALAARIEALPPTLLVD